MASFDGYGKLSNRPLEEMQQGEGDDAAELKEAPQDFALWKARKEGEDTSWASPWGEGRPGWHIECSAMAEEILGVDFEVHGGGSDLVFPHHENEIAQTEAARGKPLARVWMHNGMVEMGAEKMAKSVGNIRLLHGALEQFGREAFVMWFVGAPLPQAGRVHRGGARRTRGRAGRADARVRAAGSTRDGRGARAWTRTRSASSTRWPTTSTRRRRARCCSTGWPRRTGAWTPARRLGPGAARARCCRCSGSRRCSSGADGGGPGGARAGCRASATRRAPRATSTRADAMRDELAAAGWEVRDTPDGAKLVRGSCPPRRDRLRAQPGARGAARQAPRPARVRDRARGARGAGSAEVEAHDRAPSRRSSERAGSPDHQGICAEVEAYPYADADALLDAEDALVLALDEIQDPHNLGAVCRVAESAGCAGVVLPERRSAEVTPAVCKASAGAVEHLTVARVRNLADWLASAKEREAWVYGAAADAARALPPARLPRPGGARARLRGAGPAPARGGGLRRARPPAAPRAGSARSTCPPPRRPWCTESCISATGLTGLHNKAILRAQIRLKSSLRDLDLQRNLTPGEVVRHRASGPTPAREELSMASFRLLSAPGRRFKSQSQSSLMITT